MKRLRQDDPAADWTVPDVYEVDPGLYRIPPPLPHDSLRALNATPCATAKAWSWWIRAGP